MVKVLYIVSTLTRSGPNNQLLNLIRGMPEADWQVHVLTLSPDPAENLRSEFEATGAQLSSLGLSRMTGLAFVRRRILDKVNDFEPDVIHTHGIRADTTLATIKAGVPWVMTARNFPMDDYPNKFGYLKGWLMAKRHIVAMRRCNYLVACSAVLQKRLASKGISGAAIRNGVQLHQGDAENVPLIASLPRPLFVSVGSLIPRKNMVFLIRAFSAIEADADISLVVLGDGPLRSYLETLAPENVHFAGNVSNVGDYLAAADCFVSASLSEGLPNTVLEALAAGLPTILSDIESHQEIALRSPGATRLFSISSDFRELLNLFINVYEEFNETSKAEARSVARKDFSAKGMSDEYQKFYREILGEE